MSQPEIRTPRKNKYVETEVNVPENNENPEAIGGVKLNVKEDKLPTTQVRVYDMHISKLKKFCFDKNLTSYSELINNIIQKFIEDNNL